MYYRGRKGEGVRERGRGIKKRRIKMMHTHQALACARPAHALGLCTRH